MVAEPVLVGEQGSVEVEMGGIVVEVRGDDTAVVVVVGDTDVDYWVEEVELVLEAGTTETNVLE